MVDYCVYWFRKAHDHLDSGERAGLVGTNTVRQTNSRIASLDYIVHNGGTITEAVSSQPWTGEAAVYVSIVNWIKADAPGPKRASQPQCLGCADHSEGEQRSTPALAHPPIAPARPRICPRQPRPHQPPHPEPPRPTPDSRPLASPTPPLYLHLRAATPFGIPIRGQTTARAGYLYDQVLTSTPL